MEKVILVGAETETNYQFFDESMKELGNLTETANGEVVGMLTQKRQTVDRKTILGKGKLEELKALVASKEANTVIFNHKLTARQTTVIEEVIDAKVIDRVQLILDIFAARATSKEGQLQVELAQLSYMLPRLSGQGVDLSRLGAGIGSKGPGETKLETDRRHIRSKMTAIKHELKDLEKHREVSRQKRKEADILQIGLIGYTNAGKSTILNLLTDAKTYSEDKLFATLDPLTKKWELPTGMQTTLTDTVGFIQDLPTQLIEAFKSTLEESKNMDILLHVVDATSENRDQQEKTVMKLVKDLEMEDIPMLTVYNKADLLTEPFVPTLFPNCLISANKASDKEVLTRDIVTFLEETLTKYNLYYSPRDMQYFNQLKEHTLLLSYDYNEETNQYHMVGYAKNIQKWDKGEPEVLANKD
ncbi:GTPase HflX [Vagococcus jeotgali]|uniref:GTPase HflX n=1 Tax=Vagococcus jeotgali TaxID=3109030 RepID=UPI002DD884B0|nr:GTPase HflX [Vagococcus sp. B2T-5]